MSAKERPGKPVKNPSIPDGLSPIFAESPLKKNSAIVESIGDVINNFIKTFKTLMSSRLKKQLNQYLYKLYVVEVGGMKLFKYNEADFLDLSLNAICKHFLKNGRTTLFIAFQSVLKKENLAQKQGYF